MYVFSQSNLDHVSSVVLWLLPPGSRTLCQPIHHNTPASLPRPGPTSSGGPQSLPAVITSPDTPGQPPASDHVSRRDNLARSGLPTSCGIWPVTYRPGDHVTTISSGVPNIRRYLPCWFRTHCGSTMIWGERSMFRPIRKPSCAVLRFSDRLMVWNIGLV